MKEDKQDRKDGEKIDQGIKSENKLNKKKRSNSKPKVKARRKEKAMKERKNERTKKMNQRIIHTSAASKKEANFAHSASISLIVSWRMPTWSTIDSLAASRCESRIKETAALYPEGFPLSTSEAASRSRLVVPSRFVCPLMADSTTTTLWDSWDFLWGKRKRERERELRWRVKIFFFSFLGIFV